MQNAEIRFAGENGDAAVYSIGAPLNIADTKIIASASSGLRVEDANDSLTNVVIQDSGVYAGFPAISLNLGGDITASGVTATGNSADAIVLDGGTLTASRSLGAIGLPYQLGGALTINSGVTLTIGPGAIFQSASRQLQLFRRGHHR